MVNLCDLWRFPVVAFYYVNISALVPAPIGIRNESPKSMRAGSVSEAAIPGKFNVGRGASVLRTDVDGTKRFQLAGKTLEAEVVADRLLLTYSSSST